MRGNSNLEGEDLLTAAETAQLLRIHVVTLYSWVREGRIPSIKLGRKRLFAKRELQAWLQEQVEPANRDFRDCEKTV